MMSRLLIRVFTVITVSLLQILYPGNLSIAQAQPLYDPATASIIYVPSQVASLQNAIAQVSDGGIIELAAGTYIPPTSTGFWISNLQKSFTIQAAQGAQVILDGGGTRNVLRFMNSSVALGGPVTFKGIIFANGYSNTGAVAGGVTLHNAQATFINTTFRNNSSGFSGSGGGTGIYFNSTTFFFNSTWENNSATFAGGGMTIGESAKVYIHSSWFNGNRTNLPNHASTAAGGAIHMGNAVLRITNTRFENNQAGYAGGAIYAVGTWAAPVSVPRADLIVANSTFYNNKALRDPSVSLAAPTEGGAIHVEAQTTARVYNSRFISNLAMGGGAISAYQSILEIDSSVFLGNQAFGSGSIGGCGGAIGAGSNDTPAHGSVNMRSVSVTVQNSYIQGAYEGTTTVGWAGGGIFVAGDLSRIYGLGGVSKMGTASDNRAKLTVNNVLFNDLDLLKPSDGSRGGGIMVDLVDLTVDNSMIINSDVKGPGSFGGAVVIIDQSIANISNTTFAANSAETYGGGVFVQGAAVNIADATFFKNEVSPGVSEPESTSYGAALFTAPAIFYNVNVDVSGTIANSTFLYNLGLSVFDEDRLSAPINSVIYNDNQFFENIFGDRVYKDALTLSQTTTGLNDLIVTRNGGTPSTDKAQVENLALPNAPTIAKIMVTPSRMNYAHAIGDPAPPMTVYLGYAWNGGAASLNGISLSTQTGVQPITSAGQYTLTVDGTATSTQVSLIAAPFFSTYFSQINPLPILNWSIQEETFLDVAIDQGVSITPAPTGSIQLLSTSKQYNFYGITKEGGYWTILDPSAGFSIYLPYVKK